MKKILVVITNVTKYPTTTRATGLWFSEVVHFVEPFYKKGYEIDYVSPNGGMITNDPHSLEAQNMSELDWKYYTDAKFMNKLAQTKSPKEINAKDYEVIYYAGGHGVLWDFPDNEELQTISKEIYENGGVVSGICHGVVGLLNIKLSNGEYLIKDKKVTGFSNEEEQQAGLSPFVPFLPEDAMKEREAHYVKGANWSAFAVSDERVVTGQNPASGLEVAKKVLEII